MVEMRAKQLNDSLALIVKNGESLWGGCYSENVTRDSSFRKEMEDKLKGLQKELERFQAYAKNEIDSIQQNIDENLKRIIANELKQFSITNNVLCVLDKKSILYCDNCKDFTDDFIAYHKKRTK